MRYPDGSVVCLFDVVDGGDGEATVVGIADNDEYAPAFQPPERVNPSAGVLVVSDKHALKWRPLPGIPLRLCRRSKGNEIGPNNPEIGTRILPVYAMPAYHGFYADGQRIELLDSVETSSGEIGKVAAIISENLYSQDFKAENWDYLKFGFLVESSDSGLEWYKDADEDLKLLCRFK